MILSHFNSFILILVESLSSQTRPQHVEHLLPGDEAVAVQVVDLKAVNHLFLFSA